MKTDCCGDIQIAYRRSANGEVIHRANCSRAGAGSYEWHYAARELSNDHGQVLATIDSLPWLRGCSYCMGGAR